MVISTMIFYIGFRLGNEFYKYKEDIAKNQKGFLVLIACFSYVAGELIKGLLTKLLGHISNTGLLVQIIRYITSDFEQLSTEFLMIAGTIILTHFSFNIIKLLLLKLKGEDKK